MTIIVENKQVARNFWPKPIKPEHYRMGSSPLPKTVIMKDGYGWKAYRPIGETQYKNGVDPQSCPAGGTLNAYEHIGLAKYKARGFQSDLSERYLAILMGMTGSGGWPWDSFEKLYAYGAIPEVMLPFDSTITSTAKYFTPRPIPYSLFKVGMHWRTVYKPGAEWVVHPTMLLTSAEKKARMKEALRYSVLGVAGYAWARGADDKFYNSGPDIHFFNIDDYSEGNYWDAFDTYVEYGKKLDWNYDPNYVIRYDLSRVLGAEDAAFNPDEAPECRFAYFKYFVMSLIGNFIPHELVH